MFRHRDHPDGYFLLATLIFPIAAVFLSYVSYDGPIEHEKTPAPDIVAQALIVGGWLFLVWMSHGWFAKTTSRGLDRGAAVLGGYVRHLSVAVFAVLCTSLIFTAYVTLDAFPNSGDEYAAIFQAETFGYGRLWNPPPPHPDAFYFAGLVSKQGKWVSQYPPGWSALITAAGQIGLRPWMINPLLGGFALVAFYALCRRFGPPAMAVTGVTLMGCSAFFLLNAASFFNHTLVLLGALVFVIFAIRFQENARWIDGLVAGMALGVIGVTRHLEAVLFVAPFLVSLAWFGPARGSRLSAGWIMLGGLPFLVALLLYYDSVTGSALLPTMQWVSPNNTLRLLAANPDAHSNLRSAQIAAINIIEWGQWAGQPMLFLYCAALALKWRERSLCFWDFYIILFIFAYLLYWGLGGNRYGPRYYFPALPFVLLTILTATLHVFRSRSMVRFKPTLAYAIVVLLLLSISHIPLWSLRVHTIVHERQDLYRKVAERGLEDALVIIADGTSPTWGFGPYDLTRNGVRIGDDPVIYTMDLGSQNVELQDLFPQREFWIYRREAENPEGTLSRY